MPRRNKKSKVSFSSDDELEEEEEFQNEEQRRHKSHESDQGESEQTETEQSDNESGNESEDLVMTAKVDKIVVRKKTEKILIDSDVEINDQSLSDEPANSFSSKGNWNTCEKCGQNAGKKKADVLQEALGPLLPCTLCTASSHSICVEAKGKRSVKTNYKCLGCRTQTSNACSICTLEVVNQAFRCIRCDLFSHLQCQIDSLKEFQTLHMLKKYYKCSMCLLHDASIESIWALKYDNPEKTSYSCLVKFEKQSHLHNVWIPGAWLSTLKDFQSRFRNFRKKNPNLEEFKDEILDTNLLKIDSILDVELVGSATQRILLEKPILEIIGKRKISRVLVKWRSFLHEFSTWETLYDVKDLPDAYPDLFSCLSESSKKPIKELAQMYHESLMIQLEYYIAGLNLCKLRSKQQSGARTFKEYTIQPSCTQNGTLKDYQLEGLNWLVYNWCKRRPCILADEMGLGKTVQIASFLSVMLRDYTNWPFLIIAPTSLLANWYNEIKKWAPDVLPIIYTGSKANRDIIRKYQIFPQPDITSVPSALRCHAFLTNYESIMSEGQIFKNIQWKLLVCDEGHRLKNDSAKTFGALERLNVEHKIILTGTPLQNNMKELFSLMKFLDPTVFGDQREWESKFEQLDETNVISLHKILKPYFLRRTKQLVLKSLPPKTEVLVPVSLTSLQQEIYKGILQKNLSILRSIGGVTQPKEAVKTTAFHNVMMELRKICGHPYLTDPDIEPKNLEESAIHQALVDACGKLKLLQVMLHKLRSRGHRVLIFSQFKLVLNILEDFLNGEEMTYFRLDGDTPTSERQQMIDKFNEPDSPIFSFLLTTRTGGLGLNLATADTVIIYDADWNPHQDHQAIARVHRIGQTKPVIIYKLFTKNCVEEKIIEIGKKKMVLDHLVVEKMDSTSLDKHEVSSILRYGVEALFGINNDSEDADKKIKYDSVAVDKLLDRPTLLKADTEQNVDQSGSRTSFSFAKVWTLDEEIQQETESAIFTNSKNDIKHVDIVKSAPEVVVDDATFWDEVIEKTNMQPIDDDETKMLASERRRRKPVDYNEGYLFNSPNNAKRRRVDASSMVAGGEGYILDPIDMEWNPQEAAGYSSSQESVVSGGDYGETIGTSGKPSRPSNSTGHPQRSSSVQPSVNAPTMPERAPVGQNVQNPLSAISRIPRCLLCGNEVYHTLLACPEIKNAALIQERLDSFSRNTSRNKYDDQIFKYRKEIMTRLLNQIEA